MGLRLKYLRDFVGVQFADWICNWGSGSVRLGDGIGEFWCGDGVTVHWLQREKKFSPGEATAVLRFYPESTWRDFALICYVLARLLCLKKAVFRLAAINAKADRLIPLISTLPIIWESDVVERVTATCSSLQWRAACQEQFMCRL